MVNNIITLLPCRLKISTVIKYSAVVIFVLIISACANNKKRESGPAPPVRYFYEAGKFFDHQKPKDTRSIGRDWTQAGGPYYGRENSPTFKIFLLPGAWRTGQFNLSGYSDVQLCQAQTRVVLKGGTVWENLWGPIMYNDWHQLRDLMKVPIKALIEKNCEPNTVERVQIHMYDFRFNRLNDPRRGQGSGTPHPYSGTLHVNEQYKLSHDDPNGFQRYKDWNKGWQSYADRMSRLIIGRANLNTNHAMTTSDYCYEYSKICLVYGVGIANLLIEDRISPRNRVMRQKSGCLSKCLQSEDNDRGLVICRNACLQ